MSSNLEKYQDPTKLKKTTIRWYVINLVSGILGGLTIFLLLIMAVANLIFSGTLADSNTWDDVDVATSVFAGFGVLFIVMLIIILALLVISILYTIYYCMWCYRVNQNAQVLAPGKVSISPSLQVTGVVLPFVVSIIGFIPIIIVSALPIVGTVVSSSVAVVSFAVGLLNLFALKQIASVNYKQQGLDSYMIYFYAAIITFVVTLINSIVSGVSMYLTFSGNTDFAFITSGLQLLFGLVILVGGIVTIIYFIKMVNQISDGQVETFKELSSKTD
jgi:hypothetical protein